MEDYGPHNALVEDVIAAVEQGRVFRPSHPVDAPGALVIDAIADAKEYAWSRPIAGDESSTWNDLREDEVAPFHAVPYDHPERRPAYEAVEARLEWFFDVLRAKLPAPYADLIDDVAADLRHCALNRALHGLVPDSFWERVWQVYRQGAWPCGWDGEYPAGRMVIFQPPLAPP
jgi:hypothetical protein